MCWPWCCFLALLGLKLLREESVKGLCDGLQKKHGVFVFARGVGMLGELEVFRKSGLALLAVCAAGTL